MACDDGAKFRHVLASTKFIAIPKSDSCQEDVITVTPGTALQSSAFRENPDVLESIDLKHARLPEVNFAARSLLSGARTQWRETPRLVI
jgi:hypothetical protein